MQDETARSFIGTTVLYILIAVFILVASSSSRSGIAEAAIWRTVTVPAAAGIPEHELTNYFHATGYIECKSTVLCVFMCPVQFPTELGISVMRFSMMAYDNRGGQISARLYKARPSAATAVSQAYVTTVNSTNNPQTRTDSSIADKELQTQYGSFIRLVIPGTGFRVYGFKLKYVNQILSGQ